MRPSNSTRLLLGLLLLSGGRAAVAGAEAAAAPAPPARPARMEIRGLGWWRNFSLRSDLTLLLQDQRGPVYDVNAIEDGALLILTELTREGYLHPRLTLTVQPPEGPATAWPYDLEAGTALPRDLEGRTVRYAVERGVQSRLARVELDGLHVLSAAAGQAFFQDATVLPFRGGGQSYSPGTFRRRLERLQSALRRRGHAEARVGVDTLQADPITGRVTVRVRVAEGPRWTVTAVVVEGVDTAWPEVQAVSQQAGQPWSDTLAQDLAIALRNACYRRGYPDAEVRVTHTAGPTGGGHRPVSVTLHVTPGPRFRLGEVRFTGAGRTRPTLLRAVAPLTPAGLLDPLVLEESRQALARLGVFQRVSLGTVGTSDPEVRDAVFTLREAPRWETTLLWGYAAYEQLRVGVEFTHLNLLGLADTGTVKVVQSQKSTRGDLRYTLPRWFGTELNSSLQLSALQRDEGYLERREHGARLLFTRPVPFLGALGSAGYSYERLQYTPLGTALALTPAPTGDTTAASLEFGLLRDRRDSVLRPRAGYQWFVRAEFASPALGGASAYQHYEGGGSLHQALGPGIWLHAGLTHGMVATADSAADQLPLNKLFFPGGDNSIRGYRHGRAAPRTATGQFVGAQTYSLLNLETELAYAPDWSLVLFGDALGMAVRLRDYPFDERLYTVGLGLRYQSVIGPVRLEYGYNLNPRPGDPRGTLLVSAGFPF